MSYYFMTVMIPLLGLDCNSLLTIIILKYFFLQVKVLAMLDHPNIISYYDSFEEDGIVMIEMEYADGG